MAGRILMGPVPLDSVLRELSNDTKYVLIGEGWGMVESW